MKKLLLVSILILVTAGAAFADHPKSFGIGLTGVRYQNWEGGGSWQTALSLKVPAVPIFWAIYLGIGEGYTHLYVSGDKYVLEGELVPDINLHYYIGVGLYGMLGFYDNSDADTLLAMGARVPIGLSWHAVDFLEVFLALVPSLGVRVNPIHFPDGGWPFELGVRIWF